jgi:hypothetical protein
MPVLDLGEFSVLEETADYSALPPRNNLPMRGGAA